MIDGVAPDAPIWLRVRDHVEAKIEEMTRDLVYCRDETDMKRIQGGIISLQMLLDEQNVVLD